ncbi:O-acetylhomoserine aminocarboxypropyltransferase/cysteine synthase family protein [Butyrivibrio sp. WCD3002]|uniref:O-acetylhomoserine aminocarboxypropyltransferase/cysteine synthase family protein n=1 Tax=Butyrivibrio sp. WCD3002 TaxID=1280676 RepID=UPI000400438E|nr:aminotransferase class I/II-fold pyridoxal phosphate-dependent enzyme [Butyrivibrio sp. WCD3002]
MSRENSFSAKAIRAGYDPKDHFNSVNPPIYQTASFDLLDIDRTRRLWTGAEAGGIYSRVGNPTGAILEARIAELEGGKAAVALSSGMAAITYTLLLLGQGGGNIVSGSSLYGAAMLNLIKFLPKYGITTKFVEDRNNPAAYEELIDENTKAIYLESISNPNAELYDIDAISEVAHKYGVPVVVDNTVATPYLYRPFEHGADIVVYSATKEINGHGNVIAGLVVEKGDFPFDEKKYPQFYEKEWKMRDLQDNKRSAVEFIPGAPVIASLKIFFTEFFGGALGSFESYLVLQGLSTLTVRLDKKLQTTRKIVEFLESRDEVEWVRYPYAKGSQYKELADRDFPKGPGALLSFGFKGTREQEGIFIKSLKNFSYHVNIGDVRSLITNPPENTHTELEPEYHKLADIPKNLIRLSIGLEDAEDLIADLEQAFEKAFA